MYSHVGLYATGKKFYVYLLRIDIELNFRKGIGKFYTLILYRYLQFHSILYQEINSDIKEFSILL